jgi:hypothetical protein
VTTSYYPNTSDVCSAAMWRHVAGGEAENGPPPYPPTRPSALENRALSQIVNSRTFDTVLCLPRPRPGRLELRHAGSERSTQPARKGSFRKPIRQHSPEEPCVALYAWEC